MKKYEHEQDNEIKRFLKTTSTPSREQIFNFYYKYFLHPDHETEFTNKVARNAIEIGYKDFIKLSTGKKFHFLRALGKLLDAALTLKIWEFQLSRDDASWYWKGSLPSYYLSLSHLIEPLETIRSEMGLVDKKYLYEKIMCVEGSTEYDFLKTIQLSTAYLYFEFPIYNYEGKGDIQNLVHFIKEKNRQAIKVCISYDKDNHADSFIKNIKSKCKINKVFGFKKDFESSFPPKILKDALEYYISKYVKEARIIDINDIINLLAQKESFLKLFNSKFNVKINKPKLGRILGQIVSKILSGHWNEIFNEEKNANFDYEIFKFLKFIVRS